ncbi:desumoylating isopeptidase 1 [Punica granatum]|uniref:Desumoylating isopeptidase 1 n=1 Tax=Punica granatum TaxID=22663 RepID=A0A6P8BUA6_PUNGR|nr:desumoylating isopeptidase 1 [Punica granatum]XP_031373028.1 desumoylating isopeptidase 1 [Punica granatum]
MAEEGHRVSLNIYDLSQGLARQLSTAFLGKAIEGIWHTGVVVYGNEYYFGGGIQHAPVGTTPYGTPLRIVDLGVTHIPQDVFETYLEEISPRYTAETYSLLTHNCNNFSNEVAQFLVGASIPDYILQLPIEVMSSPMGALILPMIQNLETTLRAGAVPQVPQFKPPSMTSPSLNPSAGPASSEKKAAVPQPPEADKEREDKKPESKEAKASSNGSASSAAQDGSAVPGDPLGSARNKVQEEITAEFVALMASGTLRASEAAALATKKVMQRYGHMNVAQS